MLVLLQAVSTCGSGVSRESAFWQGKRLQKKGLNRNWWLIMTSAGAIELGGAAVLQGELICPPSGVLGLEQGASHPHIWAPFRRVFMCLWSGHLWLWSSGFVELLKLKCHTSFDFRCAGWKSRRRTVSCWRVRLLGGHAEGKQASRKPADIPALAALTKCFLFDFFFPLKSQ